MGRIQSQFGLITGTDIQGTVDQLVAISGQPRDRLISRNNALVAEQTAITELTALVIGVQLAGNRLSNLSTFSSREVDVSNEESISASAGGAAAEGDYTIRTLQSAATHRTESVGQFGSPDEPLGFEGTLEITPSGFLDHSESLASLNGGRGVERGSFRLTNRAGQTADVEIRDARTIDDVITAINDTDIGIRASTADGRIQLTDTTGSTDQNLRLTQLGNAETLADLGLFGIDVADSSAAGARLIDNVDAGTLLSDINGGVNLSPTTDLNLSLSDGSDLAIDFGDFSSDGSAAVPPTGTTVSGDLTFRDVSGSGDFANLQIQFQEENGLLAGNSISLSGSTLTVNLTAGATASDVQDLIENDPALAGRISVDINSADPNAPVDRNDSAQLDAGAAAVPGQLGTADPTLGDVVDFLNDNFASQISASIVDGQLVINDLTSGSGEFSISEGDGSFAGDLRLLGDAEAGTITSNLPVRTLRGSALGQLGGGSGIGDLTTLDITLSDGSTTSIDLSSATNTAEIIDTINASGASVLARLNDSQTGFRLRDVSGGEGEFVVSSADNTAQALGLDGQTRNDLLIGTDLQLQSVDQSTRLADLGGGITSGSFTITDSSGQVGAVNLTIDAIETVGQLIDRINSLNVDVEATLSPNGDGIALIDRAGGGGELAVVDSGNGTAAAQLNLTGQSVQTTIDGETVDALIGSDTARIEVTAEDSLASIAAKINESGRFATANVTADDNGQFQLATTATAAGDAGRFGITASGFDFETRTIARGQDGLIAFSVDGGTESFATSTDGVFDLTGLDGASANQINTATPISQLTGGITEGSFRITDSSGNASAINLLTDQITTVGDLVDQINSLGLGVTAAINDDATGIELTDNAGGDEDFTIEDVGNGTAAASLGLTGDVERTTVDDVTTQRIVATGINSDDNADDGLSITVRQLSDDPITVSVSTSNTAVVGAVETFTDQYNRLIDRLDELTAFDAESESVGLLFGSNEALRISTSYERVLSSSIRGAGEFRSIGQLGIRFDQNGRLSVDSSRLQSALDDSPDAVGAFFTTDQTGLADRLSDVADTLAGADNSLLLRRRETIQTQTERNNERVETLNERLDRERERLLLQFFRTEEAISSIQSNQASVSSIQPLTIPN